VAGGLACAVAAIVALMLAPPVGAAPVPADFPGVYPSKHDTFDAKRRRESMDLQAKVGVGTLRIPFDWSAFERAPGEWDFSTYDPVVADAASRGMRILPILFDPPAFRSSRGTSTARGMFPPSDPAAMGDFAAQLVRRYGPKGSLWSERPELRRVPIHSWQVWNEPNIPPWWPGRADPEGYTRLLEAVARAIRAADPSAEVVAAGLPNSNQGPSVKTYLTRMYAAGAAQWFDTLAIHPYGSDFYDVMGQIHEMRAIATQNGDDSPIWISELGWPTDGPRGYDFFSEEEQARLVTQTARAFAANRTSIGLRGFTYFYWRESAPDPADTSESIWGHVGLIAPDRPKPAFYAFTEILAEMLEREPPPDLPPPVALEPPGPGGDDRDDDDGGPCGGALCPAPALSRLTVSPGSFRAAPRGVAVGRTPKCSRPGGRSKRGGCVALKLDRPAELVVEIERLGARAVRIGKATRLAGAAGVNRLWLSGRSRSGALRPGLYRMLVAPLDGDGRRARASSRKFRVLAEPKRSRR
jgi:hypothetical protein